MKIFVGVDYHKKFNCGTIMAKAGKMIKQGRFPNHPQGVARLLREHGPDCSAVLEATHSSMVMHRWLEELVDDVTLAHPLKVRATGQAKIKMAKISATMLARLLCCDLIPAARRDFDRVRSIFGLKTFRRVRSKQKD